MAGRLGFLSDAHGNGPAFDRAVAVLRGLGVDEFIFLGDAVGYIPSTSVIKSLRKLGHRVRCIRGNHEEMLLSGAFGPKRDAVYQLSVIRTKTSADDLAMIAAWDVQATVCFSMHTALFVHGSPADPTSGYVYPDTDLSVFAPEAGIVFMGHTHYPFIRDYGGVRYVNIGSCGLPRDDGRYGSAAFYDPASGEIQIVRFDITAETAAAISASGLIHPFVHEVFARRRDNIFGDFV